MLVPVTYNDTTLLVLPEGNANPNRRLFMDDVTKQFVWWDELTGTELFRVPSAPNAAGYGVQLVATIDFNDINVLPAAATPTITIVGGYVASTIFTGIYSKLITPFSSPTRDLDVTQYVQVALPINIVNGALAGTFFTTANEIDFIGANPSQTIKGAAANYRAMFSFAGGGVNPQDFTQGEFQVWTQFLPFQL